MATEFKAQKGPRIFWVSGLGHIGVHRDGLPQEWRINWKLSWKLKLNLGLCKGLEGCLLEGPEDF